MLTQVIQQATLEWSSWLLVIMSIDRYLNLKIKAWRSLYFKSNHALFLIVVLGIFFFVANSHLIILIGEEKNGKILCVKNNTDNDNWILIWQKVFKFNKQKLNIYYNIY